MPEGIDKPDATDFIEAMLNNKLMTLWTNAMGEIVVYDSLTERADIQLVMFDGPKDEPRKIPILRAVPVLWPKGGVPGSDWSVTAPLSPGNPVMVWFLVHNIAAWLQDGVSGRQSKKRNRFSLSSAVCTPGVSHRANQIPSGAKDPNAYVIRSAMTLIHDLGSPEFVALANLVDARLSTIQSSYDVHTHTHGPGPGVTAIPNNPVGVLPSVAATKLKAE